jgi:hypothetical protein
MHNNKESLEFVALSLHSVKYQKQKTKREKAETFSLLYNLNF